MRIPEAFEEASRGEVRLGDATTCPIRRLQEAEGPFRSTRSAFGSDSRFGVACRRCAGVAVALKSLILNRLVVPGTKSSGGTGGAVLVASARLRRPVRRAQTAENKQLANRLAALEGHASMKAWITRPFRRIGGRRKGSTVVLSSTARRRRVTLFTTGFCRRRRRFVEAGCLVISRRRTINN